jgi:hypothetical protein
MAVLAQALYAKGFTTETGVAFAQFKCRGLQVSRLEVIYQLRYERELVWRFGVAPAGGFAVGTCSGSRSWYDCKSLGKWLSHPLFDK